MKLPWHKSAESEIPTTSISADHGGVAAHSIGVLNVVERDAHRAAAIVQRLTLDTARPQLVGRQAELDEVASQLHASPEVGDRPPVPVVTGLPGVGKSELAKRAALNALAAGEFRHVLFVDLHGYDLDVDARVSAPSLFGPLLRTLGAGRAEVVGTVDVLAADFHTRLTELAAAGEAVLFIFDNVANIAQIDQVLSNDRVHRTVVTSRDTLSSIPAARIVEVAVLRPADAIQLVADAITRRLTSDNRLDDHVAAHELVQLCGYLPLALQIVAALMADEPKRETREFVDELDAERTRLAGLEYDANWSVRAAFDLSYRRLAEDLQSLFRLLPAVPGTDASLAASAAVSEDDEITARRKLMRLVRAHLLEAPVDDRWRMHDLMRLYAVELSTADSGPTNSAFKRVTMSLMERVAGACVYIVSDPLPPQLRQHHSSARAAEQWLFGERHTIVALAHRLASLSGAKSGIEGFARPVCMLFERQRLVDEWIDVASVWVRSEAGAGDQQKTLLGLNSLASGLRHARRYEEALAPAREALELYRALGDRPGEGVALNNQANILQDLRRFDEAIAQYEKNIEICQESDDEGGEAQALANLSGVLVKNGQLQKALAAAERAHSIVVDTGDERGRAQALNNLGSILQTAENWNAASIRHREAADAYHQIGDDYHECGALNNLGTAMLMSGRPDDAIEILGRVRELAHRLDDAHLEAKVLDNIGLAHLRAERAGDAIRSHSASALLSGEIDDAEGSGRANYLLSDAHKAIGGLAEARLASDRSADFFRSAGLPGELAQARDQREALG